jgi:thiamine biosynthesis lipoprotein
MTLTRRRTLAILAATVGAVVPSVLSADGETYRWSGTALGADAQIILVGLPRDVAERAAALARQEAERLEGCFSLYRPDSELSRLNRDGFLDRPSHDFRILIARALQAWEATEGAFNPAIQPLWHFLARHFEQSSAEPEAAGLRRVLARCDPSRIAFKVDRIEMASGMALTFNGIAQGYITDAAAGLLEAQGLGNILIDLGEVYALPGRVWDIVTGGSLERVSLRQRAAATSAGRATPFTRDGTWHHLLDPTTGQSANRFASVTVIAANATEADLLSTALYVSEPGRHGAILRRFPDARALVIEDDAA